MRGEPSLQSFLRFGKRTVNVAISGCIINILDQRRMMVDASHEAFEALKAKGIRICPEGDDRFYEKGMRGKAMQLLYLIMAKSRIGDLIACEHCRSAVTEMEEIDRFYEDLLKDCPPEKRKVWGRLRSMMPSWEDLHRKYGS